MHRISVRQWRAPEEFRAHVDPHLRRFEAANNLMLGLLPGVSRENHPLLVAVDAEDSTPRLAGLQTAGHFNLILSFSDDVDAARLLADTLWNRSVQLPGVLGPVLLAKAFAEQWSRLSGRQAILSVEERVYELRRILPGLHAAGQYRWASMEDASWLIPWVERFVLEAMPEAAVHDAEAMVWRHLTTGYPVGAYLVMEHDGHPVSLAGFGQPTGTGVRVGPVYTPPELRELGYASGVVRELTQRLLDAGYRSVFLFADNANPTSNSIYQKIGYRPVVDVNQYQFP